ncbi:hypothetical protein [Paracoccus aerodenitrificans]|uniref:hypothetical protein n=1 Tax=Paracoccus aerodenitrificans TaxID=3017781 RepID=UPI0022EFF12B|nr:hypothetical protein [Paracoccus aerodenitrificans]WBU63603.1 hypothetical protein PAE61_14805 [Paracoccus aerodenitrificans]
MAAQQESRQKAENDLVLSFLSVRRAIGYLGFFLPTALIIYALFSADGFLASISAYYYSPMREVLVGTLCAQAVFLWSYEGYRPIGNELISDIVVARTAAIGALGVALMPTAEDEAYQAPESVPVIVDQPVECTLAQCALGDTATSLLHSLCAGLFFGALAIFCLVLFVRGEKATARQRACHRIYRICGWIIVAAMLGMGLLKLAGDPFPSLRPVFWLEVIASFAFATSWLVKGQALQPLVRIAQSADDRAKPDSDQ